MSEITQFEQSKPFLQPGLYSIFSATSSKPKALTIKGKSITKGSHYSFEDYSEENEHQKFYFYYDKDDGNYIIISFYSSKCIATDNKYTEIGDPLVQLPIGFSSNKKWKLVKTENEENVFYIQSIVDQKKVGKYEEIMTQYEDDESKTKNIEKDILYMQMNSYVIQTFKFVKQTINESDEATKQWLNAMNNLKQIVSFREYSIPDEKRSIYKKEMQLYQNLRKIKIHEHVESIEKDAFLDYQFVQLNVISIICSELQKMEKL